jgi:hypothetical protein
VTQLNQQEAHLVLFSIGQDNVNDEPASDDAPDVYAKFIETQTLAAAMGRRGNVEAFIEETQELDARAARIYKTLAAKAQATSFAKSAATTDEWDAPLNGAPGTRIEKTRIGDSVVCAEIKDGVAIRTWRES